jgi:aryl-alcohol dehydrogenase-like predicted oxidoreductase
LTLAEDRAAGLGCGTIAGASHTCAESEAEMTMTRVLGRSGRTVSALGFGCWAIGGPWQADGRPAGWGQVDDQQSIAAIRRAVELGVSLFDTADAYGCGHSERVLGQALAGMRDQVVVATKFGLLFDEQRRTSGGVDTSPGYIRQACQASLRRLGTDRIDLYQLHPGEVEVADAGPVLATLEQLVAEGKIIHYGTSVEAPAMVRAFAAGGRSLAQGALAWLWARSPITIPIPGFKTVAQAEENAHAMALGPLSDQQMREVDRLLHQQAPT